MSCMEVTPMAALQAPTCCRPGTCVPPAADFIGGARSAASPFASVPKRNRMRTRRYEAGRSEKLPGRRQPKSLEVTACAVGPAGKVVDYVAGWLPLLWGTRLVAPVTTWMCAAEERESSCATTE